MDETQTRVPEPTQAFEAEADQPEPNHCTLMVAGRKLRVLGAYDVLVPSINRHQSDTRMDTDCDWLDLTFHAPGGKRVAVDATEITAVIEE